MTAPSPEPRSRPQRIRDTLRRLTDETDAWVATASRDGHPCLVPLWFLWDNGTFLLCTRRTTPTARNLADGEAPVTLSLGHTRDVVLVQGTGRTVDATELPTASADAFAARFDWDPRDDPDWTYLRITPRTVRAWHEEPELPGRLIMRAGEWRS
ncbi:pyridoxamine 5'-phosphate oxidase family protein [Streptomyces sp. HNM0574]|uniref:pyridoxamine 5'-phosphate oxidase family protein n=1 Tax=Streptomyces sp. HNM0574 TaxID=2714954 RepID=UPI00146C2137|nr:pyridoxamine 5'-phosphate oxidase family protein [Streptomyces sp. HNM0574]NLU70245.1 pyridoxamine 5'-phosphate oxidase [Streptomyces sp. HNM0574]